MSRRVAVGVFLWLAACDNSKKLICKPSGNSAWYKIIFMPGNVFTNGIAGGSSS